MSTKEASEPGAGRGEAGARSGLVAWLRDPGRDKWWVAAIVLLAFALRVVYVFDMRASPAFEQPSMDVLYHVEWARSMVEGGEFLRDRHHPLGEPSPLFRAPGYIWFLAGVFRVFGPGLLAPRLFQCALGAFTALVTYLVGRRAFGRTVGLLSGLMAATYWVLIYYDGELLIPTLYVPLNMLGIWFALGLARGRERESSAESSRATSESEEREHALSPRVERRRALAAGFVFGLAAIVRPNVLLVMPLVALWILWTRRPARTGGGWGGALAPTALFSIALLTPILPITAYNTFVGGDFSLVATQGGVNFWIGNNPESDGSTAVVPGTRAGWWSGYHDSVAQAQAAEGRELSPSEVSRYYAGLARHFLLSQPAAAARLFAHKTWLLWNRWETGNNQPVRFYAYHFSPLMRLLPLGYGVLAPLAAIGLLLSLRNSRLAPLSGFLVLHAISIVIFFVCARFRVPLLPPMMVYASYALVRAAAAWRARRFAPLAAFALLAVGGAWVSYQPVAGSEHADSTGYWSLGLAEGVAGNEALAIEHLERAIELQPSNYYARITLAKVHDHNRRYEDALVQLRETLRYAPDSVDAIELYLQILGRSGQFAELENAAVAITRSQPQLSLPHVILGTVRSNQGRKEEALALYRKAAALDPHAFTPLLALGSTQADLGQVGPAIESLEAALANARRATPDEAEQAYARLVTLLAPIDRAKALRYAREYAERLPASRYAQDLLRQLGGG